MTELGYVQAVLLGMLQGLTEFLPISSSGHLVLAQQYLDLQPDSEAMLLFDLAVHVGTLLAVGIVFRRPARLFLKRLNQERQRRMAGTYLGWRFLLLATIATIITAILGLTFKDKIESVFSSTRVVGVCLILTGVMLLGTKWVGRGKRGWAKLLIGQAMFIGLAQAVAILPGISRSGATICTALFCGWRRRWAVQFSFLLAVPAILGGTVIKCKDILYQPGDVAGMIPWGPIVVGSVVSLLIGIVALRLLLVVVRGAKLHHFAWYCFALGMVTLVSGE